MSYDRTVEVHQPKYDWYQAGRAFYVGSKDLRHFRAQNGFKLDLVMVLHGAGAAVPFASLVSSTWRKSVEIRALQDSCPSSLSKFGTAA